jgi:8-oxo-dGTP diphosphatase
MNDPRKGQLGEAQMSEVGLKKSAVMVVLRCEGALLLLRRTKEPNLGKYVPVGGHIEQFETPRSAAIREVREETGLHLSGVEFCGMLVETSPTAYNWTIFVYTAEVPRFAPAQCSEGILEWIEQCRIPDVPTPTTDLHIYERITRGQIFVLNAEYDQSLRLLLLEDEIPGRVLHQTE